MSKRRKVITSDRLKGKKITFASTAGIDEYRDVAAEFMQEIFDLGPGEYLISDESDIADFATIGSSDSALIWRKIQQAYGIHREHVDSGRLLKLFAEIRGRRLPH